MKRSVSILLAIAFIATSLCACTTTKVSVYPVTIEGSIFGGKGDDSISLDLKFDPAWITKGNPEKYNPDLAAFASIISADTYFRLKDVDRGTPNRVMTENLAPEDYDWTNLLKTLGFTDVKYIESFKEKEYEKDASDSVTMTLAYKEEGKKDLFIVAVRGCFSSGEWYSTFDLGSADSDAYVEYTGEHPEWTDPGVMKGIDIAANRAMEFIREFMIEHDSPERKNYVLVTGHSRGGAISEILGARFEDDPDFTSYTYTFNSAAITADSKAENYKTIFNIYDENDFFSDLLPFSEEPHYRYGKSLTLSILEHPEIQKKISELKGREDYTVMDAAAMEEYEELFGARFTSRKALYDEKEQKESFTDKQEAETRLEECQGYISPETGLGLEAFASAELTEADGSYEVTVHYCDAALMECLGKVLSYGESGYLASNILFSQDEGYGKLTAFIMQNGAGVSGGHLIVNSYVLTEYLK